VRTIFGPTNDNGERRIKYNNELCTLYKESDIVTYIKINRLKWAGHVIRAIYNIHFMRQSCICTSHILGKGFNQIYSMNVNTMGSYSVQNIW